MGDKKKVLVIYGGPRRHKNTELLLDMVIEGMESDRTLLDRVDVHGKNISPCVSCYTCSDGLGCSIKDDMDYIYEKLLSSDIILFSCPIYFGGIPGAAKCMIDRCQAFWCSKQIPGVREAMKRKTGYFIATGGRPEMEIFKPAIVTVKLFFASFNCSYSGDLLVPGTDDLPVEENRSLMESAWGFGNKIIDAIEE